MYLHDSDKLIIPISKRIGYKLAKGVKISYAGILSRLTVIFGQSGEKEAGESMSLDVCALFTFGGYLITTS